MSTPFYDLASLVVVPSGVKAQKVYAQKPMTTDGQLTFSRASTATRVNASGLIETVASNVPRLDYQGATCGPRLLLEPQRTNVVFPSNASSNWSALGGATVTPNATTSPEGTANATAMYETNTTNNFVLYKDFTVATGAVCIYAIVKTNGRNIQLGDLGGGGSENARFNLVDGTVITQNTSNNAYIESYGNGWYKVGFSMTKSGTLLRVGIYTLDYETSSTTHVGDSTKGIFIYHVQGEQASYSTSVIPTTTAAVTRLADAASKTGISSLIGQTEGTLFVEVNVNKQVNLGGAGPNGIEISNASTSGIYLGIAYTSPMTFIVARRNNGTFSSLISTTNSALGTYKLAAAYSSAGFVFYLNGVQIGTSATLPPAVTYSALGLSSFGLVATSQGELYNQALLFKTRLTNAQLAELTAL
jgi:hypothetical protein